VDSTFRRKTFIFPLEKLPLLSEGQVLKEWTTKGKSKQGLPGLSPWNVRNERGISPTHPSGDFPERKIFFFDSDLGEGEM
jgi:hypothetical protein